ncbi:hypothetical protein CCUS01_04438 [Colletotrichum cuscutae]|uniref:Uncharacterized protein n=1 Tax=Colletotrichum cuscutae TaxID=1209917 RepID=A0AAI9VDZ8_9PEZI|nr:hypothetical protein CCUS01_04438 [Colletotrichum cuscutae]
MYEKNTVTLSLLKRARTLFFTLSDIKPNSTAFPFPLLFYFSLAWRSRRTNQGPVSLQTLCLRTPYACVHIKEEEEDIPRPAPLTLLLHLSGLMSCRKAKAWFNQGMEGGGSGGTQSRTPHSKGQFKRGINTNSNKKALRCCDMTVRGTPSLRTLVEAATRGRVETSYQTRTWSDPALATPHNSKGCHISYLHGSSHR